MKPIRVQASRSAFLKVIASRQIELSDLIPGVGFTLMCAFYAVRRASECVIGEDGDMLLFQWGPHDYGSGERFCLDFTRQFMWSAGNDDQIRQLSLSFEYPPTSDLRVFGAGNGWCQSPEQLEDFVSFVTTNRAYQALEQVEAARVSLTYIKP
jgi:hypothetical protein